MPIEVPQTFQEEFQVKISKPESTVQYFLNETALLVKGEKGERFQLDSVKHKLGPGFSLRAEIPNGGSASIGMIFLLASSERETLLRIPPYRGSGDASAAYELDPDGSLFRQFLQGSIQKMLAQGFITGRSRLQSAKVLETAERNLEVAEEPEGFAAIGNVCRSALISLADETFMPSMQPSGKPRPKGDEADTRLKCVVRHFGAGHSSKQIEALMKVVQGAWDYSQVLVHRKSPSKSDAEICIRLTTTVFDCISLTMG